MCGGCLVGLGEGLRLVGLGQGLRAKDSGLRARGQGPGARGERRGARGEGRGADQSPEGSPNSSCMYSFVANGSILRRGTRAADGADGQVMMGR